MNPAAPPVLRATRSLDQVREEIVTYTIAYVLSGAVPCGLLTSSVDGFAGLV